MEDIRKGVCPLCRHNEILATYPKGTDPGSIHGLYVEVSLDANQPAAVVEKNLRASRGNDKVLHTGSLNIYVCRSCGYCQWFADRPERIPFGDHAGLPKLVKGPAPEGPAR